MRGNEGFLCLQRSTKFFRERQRLMTQTLERTDTDLDIEFDEDELLDEAKMCVIIFRNGSGWIECPRTGTTDAFVTCDENHERSQIYCDTCFAEALNGQVNCRPCRNAGKPIGGCPVHVIVSFPRRTK